MKRVLMMTIALLTLTLAVSAEPQTMCRNKKEWKEHIKAQRKAYYEKEINFTETEAAAFWSLYEDYTEKMKAARVAVNNAMKACEEENADYEKQVKEIQENWDRQARLSIAFRQKLNEILPADKIYRFYNAEKNFNRMLIKDVDANCGNGKKI